MVIKNLCSRVMIKYHDFGDLERVRKCEWLIAHLGSGFDLYPFLNGYMNNNNAFEKLFQETIKSYLWKVETRGLSTHF